MMKLWDASLQGQQCQVCHGSGWKYTEGDAHRSPGSIPCPARSYREGLPYCVKGRLEFSDADWGKMLKTKRRAGPQRYEGAYHLKLYCDGHNGAEEFRGRTEKACLNAARRAGWRIHEERRTATCRTCHHEARRSKPKPKVVVIVKKRRRI
jgi:hypothetical protein